MLKPTTFATPWFTRQRSSAGSLWFCHGIFTHEERQLVFCADRAYFHLDVAYREGDEMRLVGSTEKPTDHSSWSMGYVAGLANGVSLLMRDIADDMVTAGCEYVWLELRNRFEEEDPSTALRAEVR